MRTVTALPLELVKGPGLRGLGGGWEFPNCWPPGFSVPPYPPTTILGGRKAAISITGTEPLCLHSSFCYPGLLPDMLITWKGPWAPAGIKSAPKLLLLVNAQVEVRPHALLLWEPAGSLNSFISSFFKFLTSFACREVGRLSVQNSSLLHY